MLAILVKITYVYKPTHKKLYNTWTHTLYSLNNILNLFLVLVVASYAEIFKGFER